MLRKEIIVHTANAKVKNKKNTPIFFDANIFIIFIE